MRHCCSETYSFCGGPQPCTMVVLQFCCPLRFHFPRVQLAGSSPLSFQVVRCQLCMQRHCHHLERNALLFCRCWGRTRTWSTLPLVTFWQSTAYVFRHRGSWWWCCLVIVLASLVIVQNENFFPRYCCAFRGAYYSWAFFELHIHVDMKLPYVKISVCLRPWLWQLVTVWE